jgi:hypothetical protein
MRTIFGVALLGLSWAVGMGALLIGLDDVLSGARLNGLFLRTTVMTSTITVELAEEAANWMSKSASKSIALLPPRCPAGLAHR